MRNSSRTRPERPASARQPDAELVVVHSSDLHVDDGYTARSHGGDGTAGLRVVLETARALGADVVLLAGDIFEHNRMPLAVLERATRVLGDSGLPVVILPGNHDPAMKDSVWRGGGVADPANVHVLGVTHDQAVHFAEFDLEIWGHAHRDYDDMSPLRKPRTRRTRWQIATAHGHYEQVPDLRTNLRPSWLISEAEIAATGADYVALGHWNRPVRVARSSDVPAYYSGCPELARTVNLVRLSPTEGVVVRRAPIRWDAEP